MSDSETAGLHKALGNLEGIVSMLVKSVDDQSSESRAHRVEIRKEVELAAKTAEKTMIHATALRERIDIMEPVVKDYALLKERWKVYLFIAIAIWGFMSAIIVPIIGGFLTKWLFNT